MVKQHINPGQSPLERYDAEVNWQLSQFEGAPTPERTPAQQAASRAFELAAGAPPRPPISVLPPATFPEQSETIPIFVQEAWDRAVVRRAELDAEQESRLPRSTAQADLGGGMNTYYTEGRLPGPEAVGPIAEMPGMRYDAHRGYKVHGIFFQAGGKQRFVAFDEQGDATFDTRAEQARNKLRQGNGFPIRKPRKQHY